MFHPLLPSSLQKNQHFAVEKKSACPTALSEMKEEFQIVKMECIEPMVDIQPAHNMPVGAADTRCICVEIARPRLQDGFTAEYNKIITACVNSNNCWMVFVGGQEA